MAQSGKTPPAKAAKPAKTPAPKEAELIEEVLDFRRQGHAIVAIATAVKKTPNDVLALLERGLSKHLTEDNRLSVLLEIDRHNEVLKAVYPKAIEADEVANRLLRQTEERIARLKTLLIPDMRTLFSHEVLVGQANMSKGKAGRPPHRPTALSVAKCETLALAGQTREVIAQIMGISIDTIDKYYKHVIDLAKERVIAQMGGVIVQAAMKGNADVAFRYLAIKGGPDWRVPPNVPAKPDGKGDEYDPSASGGAAPGTVIRRIIEVRGGLPQGSTPENPGGDNYSDVPPEEKN